MLRRRAKKMHMTIINHTSMCKGKYSWMTERKNGTQSKTTIDYVMVSPSLVERVKLLQMGETLGSDHRMLTLRLRGASEDNPKSRLREVWRVENIPGKGDRNRRGFVQAFQDAFGEWIGRAGKRIQAMEAVGVEAQRVMEIMEWSFQARMDEVCQTKLGTKRVGPKSVPMLDRAMRMLDDHRRVCERMLRQTMSDGKSTQAKRAKAVELYRQAKKELFQATKKRKYLVELETFRQIEEKQSDSKLFCTGVPYNGKDAGEYLTPTDVRSRGWSSRV